MWLVHPVVPEETRSARIGTLFLGVASLGWYGFFILFFLNHSEAIRTFLEERFTSVGGALPIETYGFSIAAVCCVVLRFLGYAKLRPVIDACGLTEATRSPRTGLLFWGIAAILCAIRGPSWVAIVTAAIGSALELRFLRFPAWLCGPASSPRCFQIARIFFYLRTGWLVTLVLATLAMVFAQIALSWPRTPGGPLDRQVLAITQVLAWCFAITGGLVLATAPLLTVLYWMMLRFITRQVDRLLEPVGTTFPPPGKELDQLKNLIRPLEW